MICRTLLVWTVASVGLLAQDAPIFTSDIENFWRAYDAGANGNPALAFQQLYFDRASPGLRDFIRLRIGSAGQLAAEVARYPKFYASIRAVTLDVDKQRKAIEWNLGRFRDLYPEARMLPVYFLIGRLSSGGTLSENGLLIGTEVFALAPGVDTSELQEQNPAFLKAMGSIVRLPQIVTHELVHAQIRLQSQPRLPLLLVRVLSEGAADFVASLVTGRSAWDGRADW